MAVADHPAHVLGLGDVGGLEAEHFHDAVSRGRRHVRMLLQLPRDVLAEVVGRPVGDVGPDHGQGRWQQLSSANWATAGSNRRLVRSPEAPKRIMRSIMG